MSPRVTVSFTGTRYGLTGPQEDALRRLMVTLGATHIVHGGCIGADHRAHVTALALGIKVLVRPCTIDGMRADCPPGDNVTVMEPRPPLSRNVEIVEDGMALIACPRSPTEILRSGTWHTVRAARRLHRPVYLIFPDGTITTEDAG